MFTTSMEQRSTAVIWAAISGALIIVGLLWAIGAVVQGQVQRAHIRLAQPMLVQTAAGPGDDTKPIPVAYR